MSSGRIEREKTQCECVSLNVRFLVVSVLVGGAVLCTRLWWWWLEAACWQRCVFVCVFVGVCSRWYGTKDSGAADSVLGGIGGVGGVLLFSFLVGVVCVFEWSRWI